MSMTQEENDLVIESEQQLREEIRSLTQRKQSPKEGRKVHAIIDRLTRKLAEERAKVSELEMKVEDLKEENQKLFEDFL